MRLLPLAILALALNGCVSSRPVPSWVIVSRYDEAPLAAYNEYRDKRVTVTGKVQSLSLVPRDTTTVQGLVLPDYQWSGEVTTERDAVAMVTLEPDGRVHCYFEASQFEFVSKLAPGQSLQATCRFVAYHPSVPSVAVLAYCHPWTPD